MARPWIGIEIYSNQDKKDISSSGDSSGFGGIGKGAAAILVEGGRRKRSIGV
jgi:hypothetical protein